MVGIHWGGKSSRRKTLWQTNVRADKHLGGIELRQAKIVAYKPLRRQKFGRTNIEAGWRKLKQANIEAGWQKLKQTNIEAGWQKLKQTNIEAGKHWSGHTSMSNQHQGGHILDGSNIASLKHPVRQTFGWTLMEMDKYRGGEISKRTNMKWSKQHQDG